MPSPNQITISQLNRLIGTPACPIIIDVCIDEDFAEDPFLIPTAIRHSHKELESLIPQLKGQKVVVVCQKGLKLSMGASAILRSEGIDAEALEGGNYAWRASSLSRIPWNVIKDYNKGDKQLWVTRHRPKIDRIACPWLIRRFVNLNARFLFVAPSQVQLVAEKFDAIPFDVEGVHWSHRDDQCTFDTMVDEFKLDLEALETMRLIVRAADTQNLELAPQAAGLLAVSLGLSRMFKDDLEQLEAGMQIYDALFRWARDATDETHASSIQSGKA